MMYKMKHDPGWDTESTSYYPFKAKALIEKTILSQTEYQYPFDTVYEQEVAFYSFHQKHLTNNQWYERFNTKVDIGSTIGVTRQYNVLLKYIAQEYNIKYDEIST